MRILVVDSNLPIVDQLRRFSEGLNIPLGSLTSAWDNRGITEAPEVRDIVFDLIPKEPMQKIEKRLSYQAQQKQLPKFLK